MASFSITPLTNHTGVEVTGLDFTQSIDSDNRAVLRRAFAEHHVLVMRDQHFDPDGLRDRWHIQIVTRGDTLANGPIQGLC